MKDLTVFDYNVIPVGYYYHATFSGSAIRQFWHQNEFKEVCKLIPERANNLLDVGCGPGAFLQILASQRKDMTAIGVDIAPLQIEFAQKVVSVQFFGRVNFKCMNVDQLEFPEKSFDVVTCLEVIEHIHPEKVLKMLKNIKKILKTGGIIIITTPNYNSFWPLIERIVEKISHVQYQKQHINRYTTSKLKDVVKTVGMEISEMKTFFVIAPFVAAISFFLGNLFHRWEYKLNFGCLIISKMKKNN
ncbi:MAG: class I SAM-dependent methyltransferase [Oligoflexia bacterium]|nr:class I SAM-dependent methyltransferase [Oligoflexia bacterium]